MVTSLMNSAVLLQPSLPCNKLEATLNGVNDGIGELVGGSVNTAEGGSEMLSDAGTMGAHVGVGVVKKVTPLRATIVRTARVCSIPGTIVTVGAVVQAFNMNTFKTMTIKMVRLRI